MIHLRQASILLAGGLFVSLLAPSCTTVGDDDAAECRHGTKNCDCKSDDTCDSGLICNGSGKCVSGSAGTGGSGQGGSAGTTTGGTAGRASGGRAGSESFSRGGTHPMGGTTQDAGAGGEPGTGGTLVGRGGGNAGGYGGSGNANGQAGEGASGEGGEPGSGGTGGTGGGAGMGGYAGTGGSPSCTKITVAEISDVNLGFEDGETATYLSLYTPNLGDPDLDDAVAMQLYDGVLNDVNFHGADHGTFQLGTGDDANYRTCSRCLVAGIDGDDKWFIATEGTLTFTSDSDQMNGSPKGTLRNVVLREATFDQSTYESTLVENGACLTFANGDVLVNHTQAPPPEVPAEWTCEPSYYADGTWCDCGCGALDLDCGAADDSVCEYCYCNPSDDMDCTAVDPSQNNLCN